MSSEPARIANEKFIIFILALIQFTHLIDFMLIMPLGKQFMNAFSISPQQFSLIVTSYAATAFVSGLVGASFIDRFDRKRILLVLYIGFIGGTFACSFAPTYYSFLAARSLTGAFGGLVGALILSIVADLIPLERRASAMGIVMTSFSVASIAGIPIGLWLASNWGLRMPFIIVGAVSMLILGLSMIFIPRMTQHLEQHKDRPTRRNHWEAYQAILNDNNQLKALLFTTVLMLGHFTIIPFIAPYMQLNIGFSDYEVGYVYMIGGIFTMICLPLFGKLADRFGNILIFSISSLFALFSIFAITNLPPVSISVALCVTSSFFVVASGRSVPATTMVTAVVKPENRASFMSVRSSANEMALALASFIAGSIIIESPTGSLLNYPYVGYIAMLMSVFAVLIAWQLNVTDKGTESK